MRGCLLLYCVHATQFCALFGCDPAPGSRETDSEYVRQLKESEGIQEESTRQLKENARQLEMAGEQQKRLERLLETWEINGRRLGVLLDRWESAVARVEKLSNERSEEVSPSKLSP